MTAVYTSLAFHMHGPYVEVVIHDRASKAVLPLQAACFTYSFQLIFESTHTPSTYSLVFSFTSWPSNWIMLVKSLLESHLRLVKWMSWYLSGANFVSYCLAQAMYLS